MPHISQHKGWRLGAGLWPIYVQHWDSLQGSQLKDFSCISLQQWKFWALIWNELTIIAISWYKLFSNCQNMKTMYPRVKTELRYLPCFRVRDDSSNKMAINASSSSTFFLKLSLVWALDREILRDEYKHVRNKKYCRHECSMYCPVSSTSVNQKLTLEWFFPYFSCVNFPQTLCSYTCHWQNTYYYALLSSAMKVVELCVLSIVNTFLLA